MHQPTSAAVNLYWKGLLEPYTRADDRSAWFQLLTTGALFVANWLLMLWSLSGPYWMTLLLALPASGLLTRLFIFQHDCGHGSFFSSRRLNDTVGSIIGFFTLTPYAYWRRTHAIHHGFSGDLDHGRTFGEVITLTVEEFRARTPWQRLQYRAYRNLFVLLVLAPFFQFVLKHRFPYDTPRRWRREWRSVLWINVALAVGLALAWWLIGLDRFLLVQAPITLISGASGIWLFYVQHQFEDTYWREHPEWSFHKAAIEGSSFYDLPAVLHWFTGNIGFHHIHHLASKIPNYKLRECFRKVPELHQVTRLTVRSSLKSARLHLWDEESQRLVGFGHLKTLRAGT